MTELEQETFRDGFRVCLLCVNADRRRNALAFRATLFDGGKETDAMDYAGAFFAGPEIYLALRRFLARAASAPHVLAVHGRGGHALLADCLSDYLSAYRVLDLGATARTVLPNPAVARHQGEAAVDAEGSADLLWAVVAEAGKQGLDWPALLAAADSTTPEVAFHPYAFNEITLLTVPASPGVYLMRDRAGAVLYVGKAANLNRRLQDYFRRSRDLPGKLKALRERIHDFEIRTVGSELEALLLEHRLIEHHRPDINVQRVVAEGRSRYAAPLLPILLVEPSAHRNRVELFCFAPDRHALQLRFNPRRPARRTASHLLDYIRARRETPPSASTLTDWGTTGREFCVRYFGKHRARLQWIELPGDIPNEAGVERITTTATTVLAHPPEATEFRE